MYGIQRILFCLAHDNGPFFSFVVKDRTQDRFICHFFVCKDRVRTGDGAERTSHAMGLSVWFTPAMKRSPLPRRSDPADRGCQCCPAEAITPTIPSRPPQVQTGMITQTVGLAFRVAKARHEVCKRVTASLYPDTRASPHPARHVRAGVCRWRE